MNITVGTRIVAELRIETVSLRRLVGAYELIFPLQGRVFSGDAEPRRAVVTGAEVLVRVPNGTYPIGFSRPRIRLRVAPGRYDTPFSTNLALILSPSQVGALEELRAGGDLTFELTLVGEAHDGPNIYPIQEQLQARVPQSAWIDQLRTAGALRVFLLEVPMPFVETTETKEPAYADLATAQRQFVNGEYASCISYCRRVLEALGQRAYGSDWPSSVWSDLTKSRQGMTKLDRERAITEMVRHYTHLAHHSEESGGTSEFSRSEAKLVLSITAAVAAHVFSG